MIYPGASPEFRVLVKADGSHVLQVRYVHSGVGYKSKWLDIPVVKEDDAASST